MTDRVYLTADELLALEFPPEINVIGSGLLKQGSVLVIGGPPKSMKSVVSLGMSIDLCCGRPIWGANHPTKPGKAFDVSKPQRVLIIEQELGRPDCQERLRGMVESLTPEERALIGSNLVFVSCDRGLRFDTTDGMLRIRRLIAATHPDIVFFDPLARFHQLNENTSQDMGKVFDCIYELRDEFHTSTGLIHHRNKPNKDSEFGDDTPDALRGSSRVFSEVDTILMIRNFRQRPGHLQITPTFRRGRPLPVFVLKVDSESLAVSFGGWTEEYGDSNIFGSNYRPRYKV